MESNNKIRGSEDAKVLKLHKDSLQAHHRRMAGSEVFSSKVHKIYPLSLYHIHNQIVEPTPQLLDTDHDLLAPEETTVNVKASEFKAIESCLEAP